MFTIVGSFTHEPPHAIFEEDNTVIYDPERYGNKLILDIIRRKGSTGVVNVTWAASSESNKKLPFTVSPSSGMLTFEEGQWNSTIDLTFTDMPSEMKEAVLKVEFLNTSGGAMLGNITSLNIVFPEKIKDTDDNKHIWYIIVPCVVGALLILGVIAACIIVKKRRR